MSTNSAEQIARDARSAYEASQLVDSSERDVALFAIRDLLVERKQEVFDANQKDLDVSSHRSQPCRPPSCHQLN